jgi:hypothetical protein
VRHRGEKGLFQNEEIWQVFGLTHLAVSHIFKEVKVWIKKAPKFGARAKKVNSQFKICNLSTVLVSEKNRKTKHGIEIDLKVFKYKFEVSSE